MPTITLCDSSTQTDIRELVSVGTKPRTPPELSHCGTQAVVLQTEKDTITSPMPERAADNIQTPEKNETLEEMLTACNNLYEKIDASVEKSAKALEVLSPQK